MMDLLGSEESGSSEYLRTRRGRLGEVSERKVVIFTAVGVEARGGGGALGGVGGGVVGGDGVGGGGEFLSGGEGGGGWGRGRWSSWGGGGGRRGGWSGGWLGWWAVLLRFMGLGWGGIFCRRRKSWGGRAFW